MDCASTLIVGGAGNNGGDGFAIARLLCLKGYQVKPVFAGKDESRTSETKLQMQILERLGVTINSEIPDEGDTCSAVVDALFGIGLTRDIEGRYADIIKQINKYRAVKIAVDIPSGVNASDGQLMGTAFEADLTITFG